MEGIELLSFRMISENGTARSYFIEAITEAKNGNFKEAEELMKQGDEHFIEGHKVHAELIQHEAQEGKSELNLLLIHAEDQMMSAEVFKIIAVELIDIHKELAKK